MTKRFKLKDSKKFLIAKTIVLAILPLILLALPRTYFDKGQSLCLFTLLTDTHCYGCGMTRACMHIIHLDFSGAAQFNKLAFIVFPILCYLYAEEAFKTVRRYNLLSKNEQTI